MIDFDTASKALMAEFYVYAPEHGDDFSTWAYHRMVDDFANNPSHALHEHAKFMSDPVWRDEYIKANMSR